MRRAALITLSLFTLSVFGLMAVTPAVADGIPSNCEYNLLCGQPVKVAEDGIPNNCEYTDGAYYQPDYFARYEPQNQQVVLVDWNTGDTLQVLESALEPLPDSPSGKPYYTFNWSPDCRYVMIIWGTRHAQLFISDVVNGIHVGSFTPDGGIWSHDVNWSPDSQQVMIDTPNVPYYDIPNAVYIWTVASDQKILLAETPLSTYKITWDTGREQVFAQPYLYDRFTGQVIGTFNNLVPSHECGGCYVFSDDGNKLAIYTRSATNEEFNHPYDNQDYRLNAITIWNRDGSNPIAIRAAADGRGYWPRIAFSADNRYLAVGGRYQVRVWDLQNLSADPSQPNYHFDGPSTGIKGIRFLDDATIETTTRDAVQRWNFITGEEVANPGT